MNKAFSLRGKSVLITGASSGIGRKMAEFFAIEEAFVCATGRDEQKLNSLEGELKKQGVFLGKSISADLLSERDLVRMVEELPLLDGVVLNAGVIKKMPCAYVGSDSIMNILHTNFTANVLLIKELIRKKKLKEGASILFISSIASQRPRIGNAIYSASKGAVNSYMKVLALELAPKKIRVNAILPGMVNTPLLGQIAASEEDLRKEEELYPLGRYGAPEDVINAAQYLLSEASSWVTGSCLVVDGGKSLI